VADTHRFLVKNVRFVTRLIRSGGFYRPDGLLEGLAPAAADPATGISGLHLYTFNSVEATEAWRSTFLDRLRVPEPA
jgi:methylenetetrahydrofolate reductase (NADPH)